MDEDRNWLKNPILPRPPAVPRFSAAELRLVEGERPSSVMRVATRRKRTATTESRVSPRERREPLPSREIEIASEEAPQSRRIA